MLHGAEGPVRGGGEGEDPLPEGAHLGEGQRTPEGEGQDHEASAASGPARQREGAADPQPQAAVRVQGAPDPPGPGHHPGPEEPPTQKGTLQEAVDIDFLFSFLFFLKSVSSYINQLSVTGESEKLGGSDSNSKFINERTKKNIFLKKRHPIVLFPGEIDLRLSINAILMPYPCVSVCVCVWPGPLPLTRFVFCPWMNQSEGLTPSDVTDLKVSHERSLSKSPSFLFLHH